MAARFATHDVRNVPNARCGRIVCVLGYLPCQIDMSPVAGRIIEPLILPALPRANRVETREILIRVSHSPDRFRAWFVTMNARLVAKQRIPTGLPEKNLRGIMSFSLALICGGSWVS